MKTYDYINYVVITLPLTVYEGTWTTLFASCRGFVMEDVLVKGLSSGAIATG